jgi:hypothetical protein
MVRAQHGIRLRRPPQTTMDDTRELEDLAGIGAAMLGDFDLLEVRSVAQLAQEDAAELYARLGELTGAPHDICVLDVFECAIAQARDPELPAEQRNWWWWSRRRKANRE